MILAETAKGSANSAAALESSSVCPKACVKFLLDMTAESPGNVPMFPRSLPAEAASPGAVRAILSKVASGEADARIVCDTGAVAASDPCHLDVSAIKCPVTTLNAKAVPGPAQVFVDILNSPFAADVSFRDVFGLAQT